jgi:hypothetical protein
MPDRLWKQTERKVATMLGGKRVGPAGRKGADLAHEHLSVEVKERRRLPAWLLHAMAQAVGSADGRLPMVVLHRAGDRYEDAMVIVRMKDWREWYGEVTCDNSS